MNRIRLLIVDADVPFAENACRCLKAFPDIEILGIETNGQDALRRIRTLQPDVLLFDLVLPGLDGISLLRELHDSRNAPAEICCTRFFSDVSLEAARTYGASFFLFKPIEMRSLHPSILSCNQLYKSIARNSLAARSAGLDAVQQNAEIRNYIVALGIPSKLTGCNYIAEAVRLARQDASLMHNLSKGLYLEISRSLNTTPTRIERCIRNAISSAYQSGGLDGKMLSCPSNKEFINYVLRNLDA